MIRVAIFVLVLLLLPHKGPEPLPDNIATGWAALVMLSFFNMLSSPTVERKS